MSAPGIRRLLRRQRGGGLLFDGLLFLLFGVLQLAVVTLLSTVLTSLAWSADEQAWAFFCGFCALLGLILMGLGALRLRRWQRHPAMLALARYGPPEQVVAAIDAELEMPGRVLPFGAGPWASGTTYLTPSWLVYLHGRQEKLTCLRLDSIVRAGRPPAGLFARVCPVKLRAKAVFEDRHGVRITVADREASLNRLLTEVVARVPWALKRFDEEPGLPAGEGGEQVMAGDRPDEQVRPGPGVQAPQRLPEGEAGAGT